MTQRALPEATPRKLPRWRGFNLLNKFGLEWSNSPFEEKDFEWIAELGFNFVRLPLDYRIWTESDNPYRLKEAELREIDRAVQFGEKYGIHVMLNFHRAPGYGATDFAPILNALREVGYTGWASLEPFDYYPDPETMTRGALRYLKGL